MSFQMAHLDTHNLRQKRTVYTLHQARTRLDEVLFGNMGKVPAVDDDGEVFRWDDGERGVWFVHGSG